MTARAAAALLFAAAPAAAQQPLAAPTNASDAAATALAVERGRLIYAYDQAAWHGTDDMLAKVSEPQTKIGGYFADGPADAPRLTFFDRQPTPQAYYVARFNGTRLVEGRILGPSDDRALSPDALRRLRALAAATAAIRRSGARPCGSSPFNTVVMPSDAAGAVRVYFLTPQSNRAQLPLGGHYSVDVTPDGVAGEPHAFSRTCLAVPVSAPAGAPRGATSVGLTVTHLIDPVPTEIHVFSSLAVRLPIYVVTTLPTSRLWTVDGARIDGPRPLPAR